jgi:uncharacterized iron-regulated protein
MRKSLPLLSALFLAGCMAGTGPCPMVGEWVAPATLQAIPDPLPRLAAAQVVLLGEQHDSKPDHYWQLATIRRLYDENPSLVLGFEMFPRAAQPALNDWVEGKSTEADFLARTDWRHVWGFPPELYLPIFRFARDHRIPMVALNVSRRVVHQTAQSGWASVPVADREGVGTPAPASDAYRESLANIMSSHGGPPMTPERQAHFIDAQLLWDRAMAEAIAAQLGRQPGRMVVTLTGTGHLQDRNGIPHQLESLGVTNAIVLLPAHGVCKPMGPDYANAVYID